MKVLITHISCLLIALVTTEAHAIRVNQAFSDVTTDSPACYTRTYTAQHLASKPRQSVERIKVKLSKVNHAGTLEDVPFLSIQVKRRGEADVWTNTAMCFSKPETRSVICSVECDGGSVEILERSADGTMKLKNNGILLHGGCGSDESEGMIYLKSQKGGDDVFLLNHVMPQYCSDVKVFDE